MIHTLNSYPVEFIVGTAAALLVLSILAFKLSSSYGIPSLLMFLVVGMLAGSEGPGGIVFSDYSLAFTIGSLSLALILFDGGMRTSWQGIRPILWRGVSLSTTGVLSTALIVSIFAHFVLGMDPWIAAVLGAIISSTDAAAVFSLLRNRQLDLSPRVKNTLELEAGSNDPMAIFLTLALLGLAVGSTQHWSESLIFFLRQAGLGLLLGYAGFQATRFLINRIRIEQESLYSLLLLGMVFFSFSVTNGLGGSGFIGVYIMGVLLGNSDILHRISILRFHDGLAWLAQITLFLVLGLLSFPTQLISVWQEGILLALFLMFIARPLSALISLPLDPLKNKERIFISWVGLRGAAPIILATLPFTVGLPQSEYLFNLVFFVVLLSVLLQGASIPFVANWLGVTQALKAVTPKTKQDDLLPQGYLPILIRVGRDSPAIEQRIIDLHLPREVLLTSLERQGRYLVPRGDTHFEAGDLVRGLASLEDMPAMKSTFGQVEVTKMQ